MAARTVSHSSLLSINGGQDEKEECSMNQPPLAFWSLSTTELLQQLHRAQERLTGAAFFLMNIHPTQREWHF